MSQKQAFNWLSEMRVDLPHLKMFQDSLLFDQNSQIQMQQGLNAYILTGFNIATPWSAGNPANSLQVVVSGAIVTLAQDPNGSFLLVPTGTPNETMTSSNTNVTGSFTPSSTNYIAVRFQRPADPTTDDLVAFWDEDAGAEFTQTVPLGLVLNYQFVINTTGFGNNASVCTVQTDAFNNIVSITNCKSGLYRLGSGGSTPNPFNSWTYASSPENPLTATSSSVDPFANNGDWELATEKQWKDAVMSAIKQIRNTAYWYVDGSTIVPGVNLSDLFWDTDASVLTMRGKFIHSQTTPGMLTWSGILNIRGIIGPLTYIIAPGTVTLADTQVAYVELVREQDFQPANTFTFVNGNTTVAATIPITGISSGDWIIFAADNLSAWAQVDTVIGSNITLYEPYAGSTATGKALRAQGSYTMQVADPLNVPASGNSFWIAKRDDNGTITATIAAAPTGAVRVSDITTFTTTAPHGINAGQGVQTSGVIAAQQTISTITRLSNVVTVTTAAAHGYTVGQTIAIAGVTDSSFDGSFPITSVPTSTTFTYAQTNSNTTSSGGTSSDNVTFNQFFEVLTVPTTSSFTVQNSGSNATGGGGVVNSTATIYLRGVGEVSQGESSSDDSSAIEAILQYIGAPYAGATQPQYSSDNYITQGLDLTGAAGQLDVRAGVQANISDQDRNLKLILGGDWENTPGTPSYTLVAQQTFVTGNISLASNTQWLAQAFTPSASGNLGKVTIYPYKTGTPTGTFTVSIAADSGGNPGTILATSSPISVTSLGTSFPAPSMDVTFGTPPAVSMGTQYWYVVDTSGSTIGGGQSINFNDATSGGPFAFFSSNSGGTWFTLSPDATQFAAYTVTAGTGATLSWSSNAFIQVPFLADSVNTILAGNAVFTAYDQVAYVELNRAGTGGTIAVTVAAITALEPDDNTLIFARFLSDNSISVGTHCMRLIPNESKPLDAGSSDQTLTYIGSPNEATSAPSYSSATNFSQGVSLTTATGALDNVLSDIPLNEVMLGGGQGAPLQPVAPSTNGNVLTSNGTTWISATPATSITSSYELLNLGLATSVGTGALTVDLKQSDGVSDPATSTLAVRAAFRDPSLTSGAYTEVKQQSALNITAPNGATLGLNSYYTFTVTSANVSVGATYTNNSQTFTFVSGAVAQTTLSATGTGAPTSSGTLTLATGTGDATITFSAFTIVPQSIYVYAINNGGTMLLGLSGSGTFDESVTQNVSQIQGSTATVISEQLTNNDLLQFSANNEYAGEKFVAQASGNLNNVVLNLSASGGLTGNLVVELHADSGGSPGTLIETSAPLDSSTITGTETNFTFTFSGSTLLNNGTTYHIVLNTSGVTYGGFLLNISIGDAAAAVMAQSTVNNSTVSTTNNATWWGQEFLTTFSGQVGNVQLTLDWDSGAPLSVGASATTDSSVQSSNTTTWYGESFTATATGQINDATLNLYWDSGTQPTGPMTVQLYSVSGGNPGTLLSTSNSVDAATLTTSTAPIDFTFTGGATLTNGTQYFIVLNTSGVTFNGANIDINQDSTEPYAGGQTTLTTNSGSTWTPQTSNLEFNVNVIGVQPTGPMTVQIYSNSAGNPGTLLGTSNTVNASTLTTSPVLTTFTFPIATSPDLANATDYFLVLNVSGVTFNSSEIDIANDNTGSYAGGTATSTSNSGGTWNPFASNALLFTVMGQSSPGNQEVSTNSGSTWTPSLTSDLYYIINSGGNPSDDIRLLYSTVPLTNVAVRLIGRVTIQEPAPGNYSAAPSALTVKNFKISDKGTVGDVVTSMLSLVQYQSVNGTGWVLMNGQPCVNSAYETMTGFTNVPLGAGTVLRMRDYGVGLDQYGDQMPGFYEGDTTENHVHEYPATNSTINNGTLGVFTTQVINRYQDTTGMASGNPGGETQGKSTVCNMFIRIN